MTSYVFIKAIGFSAYHLGFIFTWSSSSGFSWMELRKCNGNSEYKIPWVNSLLFLWLWRGPGTHFSLWHPCSDQDHIAPTSIPKWASWSLGWILTGGQVVHSFCSQTNFLSHWGRGWRTMSERATDRQTFESWGKNLTITLAHLLQQSPPRPLPQNKAVSRPVTISEHTQEWTNFSTSAHLQAAHNRILAPLTGVTFSLR